jgi:hypothetical protein
MKKITSILRHLLPLIILLLSVNGLLAQQLIGSLPTMDGGFEGQPVGALTVSSIAAGVQTSTFTCEGNNGTGIQNSIARTGTKSVNLTYTGTSTKRLLQSPTAGAGLVTATAYTVQYYYRTPSSTGTGAMMQAGVNISGTGGTSPKYYPSSAPFSTLAATNGGWTKATFPVSPTGTSSASTYGIGIIRASAATYAMGVAIDVDDFVMYAGAVDNTAPDAPTGPSIPSPAATQMTVSWTAPVTGVDGGGYIVVRSTVDPTAVPNPNGIYAVGNTVSDGVGVSGTVVYIGTGISFNDTGLSPTSTYYYRIYTVDKAFNYSTPVTVNATTTVPSYAAEPTAQITGINFSSVTSTGFTINWSAAISGGGTNHLVVVKTGSDLSGDAADGSSYSANTVLGSGSIVGGGTVVYNGTGTSVAITGLSKAITYYVRIYDFNGSGGSENYLITAPASANKMASPGEIVSTGLNSAGVSYSTGSVWVGGVAPTQYDNVTIVAGDSITLGSTQKCYNLTIQAGGKFVSATAQTFQIFGTSLVCNGLFGNASNVLNQMTTEYGGNLVISGTGSIYPFKIRPVTGLSNIGVTFDANTTITYGTVGLQSENTANDNDNVTLTINSGKTVTLAGSLSTTSSQTGVGSGNTTLNVYGTLIVGPTLNTTVALGKTYTINVNGGSITATKLNVTPSHAVVVPVITVTSPGSITVTSTLDCSNPALTAAITGTGTFNLNSGATISTVAASGLEPVAGPIRTATRNFNVGANYSYLGSVAQVTGSDLPATVNGLTITNTSGVSLSGATTVSGTLTVSAGSTLKNAYTFTNNGVATINGAFQIDEGGWATGTDFVYGAAGTLVFNNASGFYGLSGTPVFWPVTSGPVNVTVQNTGGLELQIPRTVTGLFQTSTGVKNTFGNDLTVSGTVRLNAGGYFGNFSPTYTSTGTLEYNTSGSYGVYNEWGAGSAVGYGVPQNVSVLNATAVNLSGARSIPGTLNLTSGKLSLGVNDLTIGTGISGGSATSYIVTDGVGKVTVPAASAVATLIPVGASASSYDPVSVTPATTTTFTVKAYTTLSGTAPYGVRYNPKEWDITPALASSTLIALTPSNLVESVTSPVIGHYVGGNYVNSTATMTNSNTTFTGTFDTFSPFVTGANVDVTAITNGDKNNVNAYTEANHLIVTGTLAGDIISVYGLNGQTIANVKAITNQTIINLNKGLYLVNVKSTDKSTDFKVIQK